MKTLTKKDIGTKCYVVASKDTELIISTHSLTDVSLDGEYVRIGYRGYEMSRHRVMVTYQELLSYLEDHVNRVFATRDDYLILVGNEGMEEGSCTIVIDELKTDKFGDSTFGCRHHTALPKSYWKYGEDLPHSLTPEDAIIAVCELTAYHLGERYNMDKATDDWTNCPNCGDTFTSVIDRNGRYVEGEKPFERYQCLRCGCNWVNRYEALVKGDRELCFD